MRELRRNSTSFSVFFCCTSFLANEFLANGSLDVTVLTDAVLGLVRSTEPGRKPSVYARYKLSKHKEARRSSAGEQRKV